MEQYFTNPILSNNNNNNNTNTNSDHSNNTTNSNNSNNTDIWKPDVIVLGPGGAKGYLELGLLSSFEDENYLSDINEWTGCSIGSAICLLKISGYTMTEIINDCLNFNIINDIGDINIDNFKESPGLLTIKSAEKLLNSRLSQRFGVIPTLKQLYLATGIILNIVTFNLDKMRPEYMNKDTEPNLSVVKAVLMSMAIPGIIIPRIYKGYTYVDGAIGDPYPILIHDDGEKKILGVYIDSECGSWNSNNNNTLLYLYKCAQASMKVMRDQSIRLASNNCKHIALKTPIIDTTGLSFNAEIKNKMLESGYKTGIHFLNKLKYPHKYKIILDPDEEIPLENSDNMEYNIGVLNTEMSKNINNILNEFLNTNITTNTGVDNELNGSVFYEDIFMNDSSSESSTKSNREQNNSNENIVESENDKGGNKNIGENNDTLFIPVTSKIKKNIQNMLQLNM